MRKEGWESKLAAYLEAARVTPFAWGAHDCALWAARWVFECTGVDHFSDWLGQYSSREEAQSLMRARGFQGVAAIADAHLPHRPVPLARRGDLLLHPSGTLGICGGREGCFPAPQGLLVAATLDCPKAWSVD